MIECENCRRPTHVLRNSKVIVVHIATTVEEARLSKLGAEDFVDSLVREKKKQLREMVLTLRSELRDD